MDERPIKQLINVLSALLMGTLALSVWFAVASHDLREVSAVEGVLQEPDSEKLREVLSGIFMPSKNVASLLESKCATLSLAAHWRQLEFADKMHGHKSVACQAALMAFFDAIKRQTGLSELPDWWTAEFQSFRFDPQETRKAYKKKFSGLDPDIGYYGKAYYKFLAGNEDVAILKSEPYCFAAPYSFHGPFVVFAFDARSLEKPWTTKVWAVGELFKLTGPWPTQHVTLQINGSALFVFGVTLNGAYVESFDFRTGQARFRFSTLYSGQP